MKKAFTLIELLVVVAIMGLLGTVAVGGYRQLQRGMEERGVMQNVNAFIRSAYQRAQIDRQPTAVYCWNETIRSSTDDENEIVVGRAVAVRRSGRISRIQGSLLIDEFGDLNLTYPSTATTEDDDEGDDNNPPDSSKASTMKLYQLDNASQGLKYSIVRDRVESATQTEQYLSSNPYQSSNDADKGKIKQYGFVIEKKGTADWKVGNAYGFEFATIQLPHGFIFGSSYSTSAESPVKEADTLIFKPGTAGSSSGGTVGKSSVTIYQLRAGEGGALTAKKVDTSDSPTKDLD